MLTVVNLIFDTLDPSAVILILALLNVNYVLLVYYILLTLTNTPQCSWYLHVVMFM